MEQQRSPFCICFRKQSLSQAQRFVSSMYLPRSPLAARTLLLFLACRFKYSPAPFPSSLCYSKHRNCLNQSRQMRTERSSAFLPSNTGRSRFSDSKDNDECLAFSLGDLQECTNKYFLIFTGERREVKWLAKVFADCTVSSSTS